MRSEEDRGERGFRFGPRDRRGLIAGIRTGQAVVVAIALVSAVFMLHSLKGSGRFLGAIACVLGAATTVLLPIRGRTTAEWTPVLARFASLCLAGERGAVVHLDEPFDRRRPPGPFRCLGLLELAHAGPGGPIGVIRDQAAGRLTAVISLSGESFTLLDDSVRVDRVNAWAGVLAALARESSDLDRVQWIERTVPDARTELAARARELDVVGQREASLSYQELIEREQVGALRHEAVVALSVRGPRGRVSARSSGTSRALDSLLHHLVSLEDRCRDAGLGPDGILSTSALGLFCRRAIDAGFPAAVSWPWPVALEVGWSSLCTDGTWHATYWVGEWPRTQVGADFLLPLLLAGRDRRSITVVMAPVPPTKAVRSVEHARTSGVADDELRRQHGFAITARNRSEREAVLRREQELAAGHSAYRFSGYVTVTATSRRELELACSRMEQAAALARLDLRRMYGGQALGFVFGLPTGRGCG